MTEKRITRSQQLKISIHGHKPEDAILMAAVLIYDEGYAGTIGEAQRIATVLYEYTPPGNMPKGGQELIQEALLDVKRRRDRLDETMEMLSHCGDRSW